MVQGHLRRIVRRLTKNNYKTLNRITLSRAAVLHNIALIQAQHPNATIMPVLKGNAYGHGLIPMAEILNTAKCGLIAVDGYFEAAKIRYISKHRILVLGYIHPDNAHLLDTKRCSFVVQDITCLEAFGRLKHRVRVHMELNTGMNRLGLQPSEVDAYLRTLRRFPNLELEGIMTHLADADNEQDDTYTHAQAAQFDQGVEKILVAGFTPKFIHIAQTAGSTKARSKYANAIRLGIGLYGINPLNKNDAHYLSLAGLLPVLELKSTIVKTIDLKPGDKVSYNGTFTAPKPMRIGILPLGYYEGIPRELSNKGVVTHGEATLPIVGKVCMNHTMIDLLDTPLRVGNQVTVISADPNQLHTVHNIGKAHNLFPYTFITDLSSSIRREII